MTEMLATALKATSLFSMGRPIRNATSVMPHTCMQLTQLFFNDRSSSSLHCRRIARQACQHAVSHQAVIAVEMVLVCFALLERKRLLCLMESSIIGSSAHRMQGCVRAAIHPLPEP